jgi:S-adenosylmethionine decarboxylase
MSWGHHLMLDVARCRPSAIRSKNAIWKFSKTLVRAIDMKPFGEPSIVRFGTDDKMGYTLVQLIETSNICAHFCEASNDFYLDVFSCKPFEQDTVEAVVKHFFAPEAIAGVKLERNAPKVELK